VYIYIYIYNCTLVLLQRKGGALDLLDLMLWLLELHRQTSLFGFKDKSPHSHGLFLEPSLFNFGRNF
jgi:hypothetical protein